VWWGVKWIEILRKGRLKPDAMATEEQVHDSAEGQFSTVYAMPFCFTLRKQTKFGTNRKSIGI
jgi:hypothetical protein